MHAETRTPLILLFSITGVVLLIACANIANLLLARSAGRATEMAVRLSLGATRRQLLVQLLTESCLLAVLGGLVSLLVANITLGLALAASADRYRAYAAFALHWNVVGFAALLSIGTGLLFGLYPALQSTKPDLVTTLRAGSGKLAGERASARFRTSLVTAQIALSMALLVAAGLFVKSLVNVATVRSRPQDRSRRDVRVSPELNGYTSAQSAQFFARLEEALGAIPGVNGVSSSLVPLLAGNNWGATSPCRDSRRVPTPTPTRASTKSVRATSRRSACRCSAAASSPVADAAQAPRVAVVNETFAKKFGLGRDAVGKFMGERRQRLAQHRDRRTDQGREVLGGEAGDATALHDPDAPGHARSVRSAFYVRTAGDPAPVVRAIPGVVSEARSESAGRRVSRRCRSR